MVEEAGGLARGVPVAERRAQGHGPWVVDLDPRSSEHREQDADGQRDERERAFQPPHRGILVGCGDPCLSLVDHGLTIGRPG